MNPQQTTLDPADGGYSSRKLWYAIGTSLLIFGAGLLSAFVPAFRSGLETIVGGLVGALAVYAGANVSSRWVTGKSMTTIGPQGPSYGGYVGGYGDPYSPYNPGYAPQAPYGVTGAPITDQPDPRPPVEPVPEERN